MDKRVRPEFWLALLTCAAGILLALLSFLLLFGGSFLGMLFVLAAAAGSGYLFAASSRLSPWLIVVLGVGPLVVPLGFFVALAYSESQHGEYIYASLAALLFLGLCAAGPQLGAKARALRHAA